MHGITSIVSTPAGDFLLCICILGLKDIHKCDKSDYSNGGNTIILCSNYNAS